MALKTTPVLSIFGVYINTTHAKTRRNILNRFISVIKKLLAVIAILLGLFFIYAAFFPEGNDPSIILIFIGIFFFVFAYYLFRKKKSADLQQYNAIYDLENQLPEENSQLSEENNDGIFINNQENNKEDASFEDNNHKFTNITAKGSSKLLKQCGTVYLLYWCDGKTLKVDYPQYFKESYTINPAKMHKELIDEGLLEPASIEDKFSSLKIPELKEILRSHSLKLSGKKQDLINRLIENSIDPPDIDMYSLSLKGKDFLDENSLWIDFHQDAPIDIDIKEYKKEWDRLKAKKNNPDYDDIIWNISKHKLDYASKHNKYNEYRTNIENIFHIYHNQENYPEAVKAAIIICCIDLSGLDDYDSKDPDFLSSPFLVPYFIEYISKYMEYYSREIVEEIYNGLFLYKGRFNSNQLIYHIELAIEDWNKSQEKLNEFSFQSLAQ